MGSKEEKITELYKQAREFVDEENFEEEIKILDQILKLDPNDAEGWHNRGTALLALEKYNEAINSFDKAIVINPNHENAWFNKAQTLTKLKKFKGSVESYQKLLEINPNDSQALSEMGNVFLELEDWDEAIKILNKALDMDPEDSRGWSWLAFAQCKLGNIEEGKKSFQKVIEINPSDDGGYYNLACIFSLEKDTQNALKYLRKAMLLNDSISDLAKTDEYFENIRELDEFTEIVNYKKPDFESPLQELRYRLMEIIEPSDLRISPTKELPRVWAIIMDVPLDNTWYSLICIAEGSVSLYFGNGGGIIGAGEHESVWNATKEYLIKAEELLDKMGDYNPIKLDSIEKVTFHVFLHEGKRSDSVNEAELVVGEKYTNHYLSELYSLAQDVITEIRLHSPGPE